MKNPCNYCIVKSVCNEKCILRLMFMKNFSLDENIVDAIDIWIKYRIYPGSCTFLLLKGDYEEAYKHAHPLIKPYWKDHIRYVETLPEECRGENIEKCH